VIARRHPPQYTPERADVSMRYQTRVAPIQPALSPRTLSFLRRTSTKRFTQKWQTCGRLYTHLISHHAGRVSKMSSMKTASIIFKPMLAAVNFGRLQPKINAPSSNAFDRQAVTTHKLWDKGGPNCRQSGAMIMTQ